MAQHGTVRWSDIAEALSRRPSCPKLGGYWRFYDCRYHKGSDTCSEPGHIDACPLPRHPLRNGRLNQMAYSLFLFMRDVADDDFVGWIDRQLADVDSQSPDRLAALREAIIGPLRNVYGVADKVLAMALSNLLLAPGTESRCGSKSARRSWPSIPWSIISCTEQGSCGGCAPTTLRSQLLPAGRVRWHSRPARGPHRCSRVQPGLPSDVSAVRAERDLAVLRRERPRRLQRQSHRRRHSLRQRALPTVSTL